LVEHVQVSESEVLSQYFPEIPNICYIEFELSRTHVIYYSGPSGIFVIIAPQDFQRPTILKGTQRFKCGILGWKLIVV
jgi:hypothetical protein